MESKLVLPLLLFCGLIASQSTQPQPHHDNITYTEDNITQEAFMLIHWQHCDDFLSGRIPKEDLNLADDRDLTPLSYEAAMTRHRVHCAMILGALKMDLGFDKEARDLIEKLFA